MTQRNGSHPLVDQAKILLTSVFGPYAQDDEFGSQKINPMELWHNQVTRVQGPFSLRMKQFSTRSLSVMDRSSRGDQAG